MVTNLFEGGGQTDSKRIGTAGDRYFEGNFQFTFDSSYATGGESFDVTAFFTKQIKNVFFTTHATYYFVYDSTNKKILAYQTSDGTEVPANTNLSAVTIGVKVVGR